MWYNPNSQIVMANLTSGKNSQGPFNQNDPNQNGFFKKALSKVASWSSWTNHHLGYFLTSFPCQKDLDFS
jgi:hypothetical protein